MAEQIQFTDEEVSQINQLRQDVSNVFTQLGQIAVERARTSKEIDLLESDLLKKHSELPENTQDLIK
jgi:hypothetical protein